METADVIIIGGGVHGTSIACHLARRGCTNIILLEQNTIASGPTGKTFGLIRQHYSYAFMVQVVRDSLLWFRNFKEMVGYEIDFVENGFLLLGTDEERDAMTGIVAMQQRLGIDAAILEPPQVGDLIPGINLEDVDVACYERAAGFADGYAVSMGFANHARSLGATIYEERPATGIEFAAGKITGVRTREGIIQAPYVVNAAGPWAKQIAEWVGINLPIKLDILQEGLIQPATSTGGQKAVSSRAKKFSPKMKDQIRKKVSPTVIDLCELIYFRPETGGAFIVGGGDHSGPRPEDPSNYNHRPTEEFIEQMAVRLPRRMPSLANARYIRGWAGLIDTTPDFYPIVGRVESMEGFILSCGYSGHGFKEAPIMGKLVAEEILDGCATSIDISSLRFSRFEKRRLLAGKYKKFPILA